MPSPTPSGPLADTSQGSGVNLQSGIPSPEVPEDTSRSAPEPGSTSRRGRYVARACLHCQKRKIRCSGVQPCQHCRNSHECKYPEKGRKPRTTSKPNPVGGNCTIQFVGSGESEDHSSSGTGYVNETETARVHLLNHLASDDRFERMTSRLERLEQNLTTLTEQNAWSEPFMISPPTSLSGWQPLGDPVQSLLAAMNPSGLLDLDVLVTGEPDVGQGHQQGPSLAKSIGVMDRPHKFGLEPAVGHLDCHRSFMGPRCSSSDSTFAPCCERDLTLWSPVNKAGDVATLRSTFRIFFDGPNTHYPCINETLFQSCFEFLLVSGGTEVPRNSESMQLVALIHLMTSVVKILGEAALDLADVPGWTEFVQAEHLLSHVLWSGKVSYLTIQCLITKASYLLYLEKAHLAYDTVATSARVAYQLGLHDQRLWRHHSDFESTMCQRIFWSLYCLDRAIALASGAPCIIQDSTIHVDMPAPLDDRQLAPGLPLPPAKPTSSSVPYLHEMVRWARLYSDTCRTVSTMSGTSVPPETIEALDHNILVWMKALPPHLTWSPDRLILDQSASLPHFILRQCVILFLRGNYLRLLIRQEDVINKEYKSDAAAVCVTIATNSIDVVHLHHYSFLHRPVERHSSVTFLAGALIPLVCVILKERPGSSLFHLAAEPFRKAMAIMHGISPSFAYARHTLARLQDSLTMVNKKLELHGATGTGQNGFPQGPSAGVRPQGLGTTGFEGAAEEFTQPLEDMLNDQSAPDQLTTNDAGVDRAL